MESVLKALVEGDADRVINELNQLKYAGRIDGNSLLHIAVHKNHVELARRLLLDTHPIDVLDGEKNTPLHIAANYGSYEMVNLLLEFECDFRLVNSRGFTALQIAKEKGFEGIAILINRKINP